MFNVCFVVFGLNTVNKNKHSLIQIAVGKTADAHLKPDGVKTSKAGCLKTQKSGPCRPGKRLLYNLKHPV